MEDTIEVRYAGVVVGRSTSVRDVDEAGGGGLFLGVPDPLPVGTVIALKVGDQVVEGWVEKVVESAEAGRAGMRIQLSDRSAADLFGAPAAPLPPAVAPPAASVAPPAAAVAPPAAAPAAAPPVVAAPLEAPSTVAAAPDAAVGASSAPPGEAQSPEAFPESSDDDGASAAAAGPASDASGAAEGGDASGAADGTDDRLPAPDPSAFGRPGGGGGRRGRRGKRR